MKLSRIKALAYRDYLIFIKSKWRWIELFYFPITSLIIWGFFALWTGEFASVAGRIALVVNVFWSYAYCVQSTINLSINEDTWHSEAHHLFISGIGKWEYLFGRIIFSLIVSSLNMVFMLLTTHFLFFNISRIIFEMVVFTVLTALTSIGIAILTAGLYFMLGREYAWLSWSSLQFFILLSFPLSPIEILPHFLQTFAKFMPYGLFFQALRNLLIGKFWFRDFCFSSLVAFLYFSSSVLIYKLGFDYSRKSGKFAKMF